MYVHIRGHLRLTAYVYFTFRKIQTITPFDLLIDGPMYVKTNSSTTDVGIVGPTLLPRHISLVGYCTAIGLSVYLTGIPGLLQELLGSRRLEIQSFYFQAKSVATIDNKASSQRRLGLGELGSI